MSSTTTNIAILRQVPDLAGVGEDELTRIASRALEVDVAAGELLADPRERCRSRIVIVDGWAAVSVAGEVIAAVGPGEVVDDCGPAGSTVTAKTPMRVLALPGDAPGAPAAGG